MKSNEVAPRRAEHEGIQLGEVIPFGRSYAEYVKMFGLSETDLGRKILDCGGGPASFNCELTNGQGRVVSLDPVYQFSRAELEERISVTFADMIAQVRTNLDKFVWKNIKDADDLAKVRMSAMQLFLEDFEMGKREGRYLPGVLPALPFADAAFELALCSHFLFLYTSILSLDFHLQAITEMLRVASEVRIFPLVDLNVNRSPYVDPVIEFFKANDFRVSIETVDYEFQKGGNQLLRINS
jgi:ubiquinone/menaquinone biosynthesis C-methylase UbiE